MENIKPKRGAEFYWAEKGMSVWLERIISQDEYFVYDNPARRLSDNDFVVHPDELTPAKKGRTAIKTRAKSLTKEEKEHRANVNVFFASQLLLMPDRCENCGQPMRARTPLERRGCIAHILPKKNNEYGFPNVATHPLNRMFLSPICGCHGKWDNGDAASRIKMDCYNLAIERFNGFKEKLTPKQLIRAYTYLNISWD